MITSPKVRDAFDLTKEPESRPGAASPRASTSTTKSRSRLGQQPAPAGPAAGGGRRPRRDAVAGHLGPSRRRSAGGIFPSLKTMLPLLDQGIHALLTDLHERGLDQDVLVVVLGEFGRTPKVNEGAGREHWAEAGCVLFAAAAWTMGQVIGETDSRGERTKSAHTASRTSSPPSTTCSASIRGQHHPRLQRPADVPARRRRADRGAGLIAAIRN